MRRLLCVAIALAAEFAAHKEAKVVQVTLADLERETASLVYFNLVAGPTN